MSDPRKLPSYAFLSPEGTQRQMDQTQRGLYSLLPSEIKWRDRQPELRRRGYALRPRYALEWTPSWVGTSIDTNYCEDAVVLLKADVMDARRSDGSLVAIKSVSNRGHEVKIAQYLSSLPHPGNHCVAILDVFPDPLAPNRSLMVMPYLRPFFDPEFSLVGELIDFVTQMLEGLAFMHAHNVVHRDIAPPNVMMDGTPLYPLGHHPVRRNRTLDVIDEAIPLSRTDHPVRYYYIDFGLSERLPPSSSSFVVGDVGRDAEVPELSSTVPYDGYKADIYALGNLFYKELVQKYNNVDFLMELVDPMKQREPALRPSAGELVSRFNDICNRQSPSSYRWRLGSKSEPAYERMFNDTVAVAWEGLSQLRKLVK